MAAKCAVVPTSALMSDRVGQTGPMDIPRLLVDATIGDWVNERLLPPEVAFGRAGAVVPTGFRRVVRVLHPTDHGMTWADTARSTGKVVHPLVQWGDIVDDFDGLSRSDHEPAEGRAPTATLDAILDHCPAHGGLIYAVWNGWGSWEDEVDARILMPGWGGRDYRLHAGPKAAHTRWPGMSDFWSQTANIIWPIDRSWCIATEIDWDSTLVACSDTVAAAILDEPRLESFEVAYDSDLTASGDNIDTD
jgi:hypothetical protein